MKRSTALYGIVAAACFLVAVVGIAFWMARDSAPWLIVGLAAWTVCAFAYKWGVRGEGP